MSALSVGCDLPDKYLLKLFAQGSLEHRDHFELDNYKDFTELKYLYPNLIKPREKRPVDHGKNHYTQRKFLESATIVERQIIF